MRALMKKRKEQGVSDLEAGVSQSWKVADAKNSRMVLKRVAEGRNFGRGVSLRQH